MILQRACDETVGSVAINFLGGFKIIVHAVLHNLGQHFLKHIEGHAGVEIGQ